MQALPLNIKDERTYRLVRRLAALTGENMTEAVRNAVRDRLKRQEVNRAGRPLDARLREIAHHCASLPIRRRRAEDDILGYNERGMPD
jgi:antitoxin VapB